MSAPAQDIGRRARAGEATPFVAENRVALGRWVAHLEDIEAPILAISRKTPRLLELLVRAGVAPPKILDRVITEHSMWLRPRIRELVLADDVLIRGSTFLAVHRLLMDADERTTVYGLPLVVSESARARLLASAPGAAILARPPLVLDDAETLSFATAEINAMAVLGKPLDLDHPIVYASAPLASAHDVGEAIQRCAGRAGLVCYGLRRRPVAERGGTPVWRSWTVLAPGTASELRKLRFFFDPAESRLAIVAIAPTSGTERGIAAMAASTPLRALVRARPDGASELGLLREQASVAWHNYLVEFVDLRPLVDEFLSELDRSGLLAGAPRVNADDIACLIPRLDALEAASRIDAWLLHRATALPADVLWQPAKAAAIEASPRFRWRARAAAERASSYPEAFSAVLRAHRLSQEASSADEPRLRFDSGLTLGQLGSLTERWSPTDSQRAHRALDSLIDSGVAIPRYVYAETADGRTWLRAFRHGEANPDVRAMVLVHALDALTAAVGSEALPEVLAEKYVILLAEHLDIFSRPDLAVSEGIQREWYLYGARPVVDIGGDTVYLQKWAVRRGLLAVVPARAREGRQDRDGDERPDSQDKRYRVTADGRSQWGFGLRPDLHHLIAAVARWTAQAYTLADRDPEKALGTSFLNAIASCESESAYESALLAELEGWLEGRPNVETAWQELAGHLLEAPAADLAGLDLLLQRLANWPAQGKVKRRLHERLDQYLAAADRAWPQGTVGDTDTTWRDIVRPAVVGRRHAPARDLASVEAAVDYCARTSFLLRCVLSDSLDGLPSPSARPPFGHTVAEAVRGLEELLDSTAEIPIAVAREALRPALGRIGASPVRDCLREIGTVVREVAEAVRLVVDPLTPERTEVKSQSRHFCLVWDVRDSAKGRLPAEVRQKVNRIVGRRFGTAIEGCDVLALTDSNQVVMPSLRTAREVMAEVDHLYRGHGFSVRFGLDMTSEAVDLYHVPPAQRPTGTLLEHATRLCNVFLEIARDRACWSGARPPEPTGSYVVTSQSLHAFEGSCGQTPKGTRRIPGSYTPRVKDAGPRTIYIHAL